MFERSPLGSTIVWNAALFDPQNFIISSVEQTQKQFRKLLNHIISLKFIILAFGYKVLCQFSDFLENEVKCERNEFFSYDRKLQRVDEFYFDDPINLAQFK